MWDKISASDSLSYVFIRVPANNPPILICMLTMRQLSFNELPTTHRLINNHSDLDIGLIYEFVTQILRDIIAFQISLIVTLFDKRLMVLIIDRK